MGIKTRSCEKNKCEMANKNLFHSEQTDPISVDIPGITEINSIPITSQNLFSLTKNNWISPETKTIQINRRDSQMNVLFYDHFE